MNFGVEREPSQCKDCFIPSHQIGVSSSLDKETGSSQHASSDGSKEEGGSDLNMDGKCTCGICRAKRLLSNKHQMHLEDITLDYNR